MQKKQTQTQAFLAKLQKEAAFQKKVYEHRVLPKEVDVFTSYVGTHTWQTLLAVAVVTAFILECIEKVAP